MVVRCMGGCVFTVSPLPGKTLKMLQNKPQFKVKVISIHTQSHLLSPEEGETKTSATAPAQPTPSPPHSRTCEAPAARLPREEFWEQR